MLIQVMLFISQLLDDGQLRLVLRCLRYRQLPARNAVSSSSTCWPFTLGLLGEGSVVLAFTRRYYAFSSLAVRGLPEH